VATLFIACSTLQGTEAQQSHLQGIDKPISITLAGYGPPTSSFSQGLKLIGDRLSAKFGDEVRIKYVYNILDFGYDEANIQFELVKKGALTLGYVTMSNGYPALEVAALPFLFSNNDSARAAMDGALGQAAIESIEASSGLRILGFYENGFRHISNSIRPVHTPADLKALKIRVLAVQKRTFEMLGASPLTTALPLVVRGLESGELQGQENPFENVVTYSMYKSQKFYTKTYHSYLSRPIFVNRESFDAWPVALQTEFRAAVKEAVALQRRLHDQAEIDAENVLREHGEIVELTPEQHQLFVDAVAPIYTDAKQQYGKALLGLVGL
jgi:TRAP-type C4-dicarboxylate transport system substrate-binding protein